MHDKGDVQICTNYHGVKFMSHTLKLWVLDKRSFMRGYIGIIKGMYEGVIISVRTTYEEIDEISIAICLHQGLALSSRLFALIIWASQLLIFKRYFGVCAL